MAATITDLSRRGDQGFALPVLFGEAHALLMAWLTTANSQNGGLAWRGVWNPASYATRTVNFKGRQSVAVPSGQGNSFLVQYGTGYVDPTDPTAGSWDLYLAKYVGSDFQTGVNIPIAPAPSSIALIGLGALVAGRRRR